MRKFLAACSLAALSALTIVTTVLGVTSGGDFPH